MTIVRSLLLVMLTLSVAGCESGTSPPPPVKDTVFRDLAAAEDKARAVEGTLQQQKEALDRRVQESE